MRGQPQISVSPTPLQTKVGEDHLCIWENGTSQNEQEKTSLVKFTGPTMTMSVPMTPVWGQTGNFYWAEEM